MTDDETLARILRRFLVGDEYWRLGENELLLDGTVEVSDEETIALAVYLAAAQPGKETVTTFVAFNVQVEDA